MPINRDAVGFAMDPVAVEWSSKDAMLYALAIGCGAADLQFTTESSTGLPQQVIPTFAVVVYDVAKRVLPALGDYDSKALFHGEQAMTFHKPLEPEGKAEIRGGIAHIHDKGSGALIGIWTSAFDARDNSPLFDLMMNVFLAGEGGWGGERGGRADVRPVPNRPADEMVIHQTDENQALLYRLTGDRNPLHFDPVFAAASGFEAPILHGLCTLGMAGRQLLKVLCGDDPSRLRSLEARFAAPVRPGDALTCSIWRLESGSAMFEVSVNDKKVINRGLCRYDS